MREKLSQETVKRLPVPGRGNRITYFAGATIQGAKAPRGFGVRVTAGGARAFILNYRLHGHEHRFTIGAWPDWSVLKAVREARNLRQRVDRGRTRFKIEPHRQQSRPSLLFSTSSSHGMSATRKSRCGAPMKSKVRLIGSLNHKLAKLASMTYAGLISQK